MKAGQLLSRFQLLWRTIRASIKVGSGRSEKSLHVLMGNILMDKTLNIKIRKRIIVQN